MAKTTKKTAKKAVAKKNATQTKVGVKKTSARKAPVKKVAAGGKKVTKKAGAKHTAGRNAAANPAAAGARSVAPVRTVSIADRHRLVAEAAYLRSESQGFVGDAHNDWLAAESEVDGRLRQAGIRVVD